MVDPANIGVRARGAGKSATAYRTISEVSDELAVPQHVLRFWETKFSQVRPLKRGGGRRYYRPEDVDLLRQIRDLLYTDGYTIKGVQRLLRDSASRVPAREPALEDAELSDRQRRELESLRDELAALRALLRSVKS